MRLFKAIGLYGLPMKCGKAYYVFPYKTNIDKAREHVARETKTALKNYQVIPVWITQNGLLYLQKVKNGKRMIAVTRK